MNRHVHHTVSLLQEFFFNVASTMATLQINGTPWDVGFFPFSTDPESDSRSRTHLSHEALILAQDLSLWTRGRISRQRGLPRGRRRQR